MDPIKLRHFLAVIDSGHFSRAAERLGVSQPAISKSIRALEAALGVALFERGQFGAQPNAFGQRLAAHARIILAEGELARAELAALRNAADSQLTIGASVSIASRLLPLALERFRARWPDIVISVEVGLSPTLFDILLRGELDFVISGPPAGVPVDEALAQSYLLNERDCVVAGREHPLAGQPGLTLADLLPFPWIVPRRSGRFEQIRAAFAAEGLPPPPRGLRTESTVLARALLDRAPYICLIGRDIYGDDLRRGLLCALDVPALGETRPVFVTTRRRSTPRLAARNMVNLLRELVGRERGGEV